MTVNRVLHNKMRQIITSTGKYAKEYYKTKLLKYTVPRVGKMFGKKSILFLIEIFLS